jgi:hypothetical protein
LCRLDDARAFGEFVEIACAIDWPDACSCDSSRTHPMKTTNRKKLQLNREALVELNVDVLPAVVGGVDAPPKGGDDHRSYALFCINSNNNKSCVGCR